MLSLYVRYCTVFAQFPAYFFARQEELGLYTDIRERQSGWANTYSSRRASNW